MSDKVKVYSFTEAWRVVEQEVARCGSERAFCLKYGIHIPYFYDVKAGRRPLTDGILKHVGLRKAQFVVEV